MHSDKLIRTFAFAGLALAAVPGCGDNAGDPPPIDAAPPIDSAPPTVDAAPPDAAPLDMTIQRSILINDQATLAGADFSLTRTVQAILDSSEGADTTPEAFLASLLGTFDDPTRQNPDGNLITPVDVRPGEAALSPA
ncbi:MAG TPA: hypothetical protein VNM90_26985, partial [Haliangium sp.]|nr:hypothetical protein [Haliangium sp.]